MSKDAVLRKDVPCWGHKTKM